MGFNAGPTWRSTIRILLIDDEPLVRETLALLLIALGHSVVQASTGDDGIGRLEAGESVDLVMTDLGMPGISGWDVARIVRERWPSVRVGIITGSHGALAERRVPVDFAITKPVALATLESVLGRLPRP